ncbi:MAG: oxidoreductase [Thermodesulfobacteriota bacterium]|nr:oxidoreductase [Thermodesulfobacteriota bacterium]
MRPKPKVAIYWLGACAGCDEAIVDLNEGLLSVTESVDIVLWPVAMDFKYDHLRSMGDGEITLSILSGSVRNSDHQEMAELMRKKSQLVFALGTCACFGGSPGLANFTSKEEIFNWVYRDAPTVDNPNKTFPQKDTGLDGKRLTLPEFFEHVYTLDQIIDVDYYLPGCPPPPELISHVLDAVLSGGLPPKGSTLAPRKALCDTCPRNQKKPARMEIRKITRIHEVDADKDACFLAEGIICLGPATRGGCGESCIRINVPCRGCFGPVPGVMGSGPKFLSTLTSLITVEKDEDIDEAINSIDDPAGYLYRFAQASSILGKRSPKKRMED